MTVAAAVAAVAPAGPERKHGSYVDADEEYLRRETIAAAAAAAAACHRREVSYRRPFVGLRLPRLPRPPLPKTTADKSMRVRGGSRRTRHRPLFRNFVGLALGVGGTDGVF